LKTKSNNSETVGDNIPEVAEACIYTSSDSQETVVAYYDDKIPASGWEEVHRTDTGSGDMVSSLRQYEKNGGNEFASIQVSSVKNGTLINMMWKYPK
jgi:hypothetical protein